MLFRSREGMRLDTCVVPNSICAPSRATVLTGKYSHLNGVRDNAETFDGAQPTFPKLLRAAGYQTAFARSDNRWRQGWNGNPAVVDLRVGAHYYYDFRKPKPKSTKPGLGN